MIGSGILAHEDQVESAWMAYSRNRRLTLLDEVLDDGRIMRRFNQDGRILELRGKHYYKNLLSIAKNESMVETLNTLL